MAKCVYNLMGRVFNSEFELDNFILNNRISIDNGKLSDIVFSTSPQQLTTISILEAAREKAELIDSLKRALRNARKIKGSQNELAKQKAKFGLYIGVTAAIKLMEDNRTRRKYTPEFIEENYKSELEEEWKTKGIAVELLPLLDIVYNPGDPPIIVDNNVKFEELYKKLKNSWENIAKIGSAAHKIFELYWKNVNAKTSQLHSWYVEQLESDSTFSSFFEGLSEKEKELKVGLFLGEISSFHNFLIREFGKDLKFIPEYPVLLDTTMQDKDTKDPIKLLGIIDLVVVDSEGVPHVFDYKFSSKNSNDWHDAKRLCYMYQTGLYKAGLQALNINTTKSVVGIVPFQLLDFNGKTYTRVVPGPSNRERFDDFTSSLISGSYIGDKILQKVVLPSNPKPINSTDFLLNMEKDIKKICPGYKLQQEMDENVEKALEEMITPVKGSEKCRLPNLGFHDTGTPYLEFENYAKAHDFLKTFHEELLQSNYNVLTGTIANIKRAMAAKDPSLLVNPGEYNRKIKGINRSWFYNKISRYCVSEWEVAEIPEFESLGILVLHNIRGDFYNFICIDNLKLDEKLPFKRGEKITGSFIDDITPLQYGVDLLDGDIGNLDNIKVMLAINNYPEILRRIGVTQGKIGEIFVMNPRDQVGHSAGMKQLRDNFRLLCSYAGITNNFENGTIKYMNYADLAREALFELGACEHASRRLNKVYSIYERSGKSIQNTTESLLELKRKLEEEFSHLLKVSTMDLNAPETEIYILVLKGLLALGDIHHVLEFGDIGWYTSNINAPSRQDSKNLQNLGKTSKEVYRLIRKDMNLFTLDARKVFERYEDYKGFNTFRRLTINDEPVIYKNLFRDDPDKSGKFKFRNPYTDPQLNQEEKQFLKWVLETLYKYKHLGEHISKSEIMEAREDSESDYYDVPLLITRKLKDKLMSKEGRKGFSTWTKEKMGIIKNPILSIKQLDLNALTKELAVEYYKDQERFDILDIFELSDDEVQREHLLKENSKASYSFNIKDILFEYANAKIRKKHMDEYIPIFLAYAGIEKWEANVNNVSGMEGLGKHVIEFINAKILNKSIIPDLYKPLAKGLLKIRNITTYSTLALSPRSYGFQRIEGMFKNASRSVIKPNGLNLFTFDDYKKALLIVEGATKDFAKAVSLTQALNEWYGLNDQDMNSLAKRLKLGMLPADFLGQMLWMTSIPDFYNRLTIFIAQMIHDGCFDAHEMNGTELVYNWKKDKRFSIFANANGVVPTDPELAKKFYFQKALYHAKMEELQKAGYKHTDKMGNERPLLFDVLSNKPGDDLPIAYTFNEANDLKSYSDLLYGYYNHEDLMLLKSKLLGASYLLFRAWWSSLSNRYYLKGNVYNRTDGEYVQATIRVTRVNDKGEEYQVDVPAFKRFFVDETGNITGFELTDEDTGEPAIIWKGKYFEGILNTFWGGLKSIFNGDANTPISKKAIKFLKGDWDPNANDDVKRVRLKNMLIWAHDLTIWGIIGLLALYLRSLMKQQAKKNKNKNLSFAEKSLINLEEIGVSSLVAATADLLAFGDLINPLTNWTPPSFEVLGKMIKDGVSVITGEKTFGRAVLSNIGVAKQTKEYWYRATSLVDAQ